MGKVPVPRNVIGMKVKFLFGLTKRQVICFGSGILVGLPFFLVIKKALPANIAALLMIAVMLPFFLFAMYEKNGPTPVHSVSFRPSAHPQVSDR